MLSKIVSKQKQKKFKRYFVVLLCAILTLSTSAPIFSAQKDTEPFTDIGGHWAQTLIQTDAARGFIAGYGDGTFRPDVELSTAELIAMVNQMFGLTKSAEGAYTDIPENAWYEGAADTASYYGYFESSVLDGGVHAKRLDMLKMLDALIKVPETDLIAPFDDLKGLDAEVQSLVNRFYAAGYLNGEAGLANLYDPISRAEMLAFFDNTLGYIVRTQDDVAGIPDGGRVTVIGQNISLKGISLESLYISPGVYTEIVIENSRIGTLRVFAEDVGNTLKLVDTEVVTIENLSGLSVSTSSVVQAPANNKGGSSKDKDDDHDAENNNAETPRFDGDLTNQSVKQGMPLKLDPAASVEDGGVLTYQWYQAEDALKTNAIALSTTSAVYTVDTSVIGVYYYYCAVTNTNENAAANKTAHVDSAVSRVEVTTQMTGAGTVSDPYVITSIEALCLIGSGENIDGNDYTLAAAYRLGSDLDLADPASYDDAASNMIPLSGWTYIDEQTAATEISDENIIGFKSLGGNVTVDQFNSGDDATGFTGVFDGDAHIIRNLYMDMPSPVADGEKYIYTGLFSYMDGAEVFDLGIEDVSIAGSIYLAGLSTFVKNQTSVSHCYVTGRFFTESFESEIMTSMGGLVGLSIDSNFTACYATCHVDLEHDSSNCIGGLLSTSSNTNLNYCFASLSVGSYPSIQNIIYGQIVGIMQGGSIKNSYGSGSMEVFYECFLCAGGLVSMMSDLDEKETMIENCYATSDIDCHFTGTDEEGIVGGLIGDADNDYGNVTIHHSIAFNAEITTAATSTTGRIIGMGKVGTLTLDENYANAAMKINGVTVASSDASSMQGADLISMTGLDLAPLNTWEFGDPAGGYTAADDVDGDGAFWVLEAGMTRPVIYTDPDGDGVFEKMGELD